MRSKREILQAVINGNTAALNQLPRIVLFCITDNKSNGIYQVTPPNGQTLPTWCKTEMTKAEIETVQAKNNVLPIIIEKNYE